jgi:hypothetical protein
MSCMREEGVIITPRRRTETQDQGGAASKGHNRVNAAASILACTNTRRKQRRNAESAKHGPYYAALWLAWSPLFRQASTRTSFQPKSSQTTATPARMSRRGGDEEWGKPSRWSGQPHARPPRHRPPKTDTNEGPLESPKNATPPQSLFLPTLSLLSPPFPKAPLTCARRKTASPSSRRPLALP